MSFTTVMDAIVIGLQAAYPTRIVTRERRKWMQYTDAEAKAGLIVVNSRGATFDDRSGVHQIQAVLVQRLTATTPGEAVTSEQVEEAEFSLFDQFRTWVDTHNTTGQDCAVAGFMLDIREFTQPPAEAKQAATAVVFVELERPIYQ
jgi:hypothetical protein